MADYAIYLRKSRADIEAEARGEGETLERHRTALRALAERRGLNVVQEYAELVTGDSIAARPQMQALLDDVKKGLYAGVIVNDVDRLGRGDSIDQEIIKYTFVAGHCLIITPTRDINPASPSDEDMLDFSLFFARYEYRKITQRMAIGRTRSAQAGNFIASTPPYGYRRSTENRLKLEPDEDTADVVRMIFDMYASGTVSLNSITRTLNDAGITRPKGGQWDRASVKYVLRNPVYTGKIVWGRKATISIIENGTRQKKRIKATPVIVDNIHEAIVSKNTYDKVQRMFESNEHPSSVNTGKALKNPLAGLLYCSQCGKPMLNHGRRGKNGEEMLIACLTRGCPTMSAYLSVIMGALIEILSEWCAEYRPIKRIKKSSTKLDSALVQKEQQIQAQIQKAQELVETGIYTPSEYLQRKRILEDQLTAVMENKGKKQAKQEQSIPALIPMIKQVIEAMNYTDSPEEQNALLKTIIARIDYTKTKRGANKQQSSNLIELVVYPKFGGSM